MRGITTTLATIMMLAVTVPATAQGAARLGQFKAWGTYSYKASDGKVCFVASVPEKKEPSSLDHGNIYFYVSMKPGQNISYEPQFITSYNMAENSKVNVIVDNKSFSMFVRGKSAWLENAAQEPQLIKAMKAGSSMMIKARSGRGNPTAYSFSLSGVSAALKSISSCK